MRLRDSTGDECPSGRAVFQITPLSGPNSVGRLAAVETPVPFGPRNRAQSGSAREAPLRQPSNMAVANNRSGKPTLLELNILYLRAIRPRRLEMEAAPPGSPGFKKLDRKRLVRPSSSAGC